MNKISSKRWFCSVREHCKRSVTAFMAVAMLVSSFPLQSYAMMTGSDEEPPQPQQHARPASRPVAHPQRNNAVAAAAQQLPDSISVGQPITGPAEVVEDEITQQNGRLEVTPVDSIPVDINRRAIEEEFPETSGLFARGDSLMLTAGEQMLADSVAAAGKPAKPDEWVPRKMEFSPDPTKAVWFAALFPGLGQVYNRRYWKLPIVVGGYLGLAYATTWNNGMLRDYTKAYADLLDNDPDTRSYMDLFAPSVKEENLDKTWLQNVINSRKNYFRRNRDLCIICMIGVYLLAMVDAYVDASLSHFDITPDLTVDLAPALLQDGRNMRPSVGLVWALNF